MYVAGVDQQASTKRRAHDFAHDPGVALMDWRRTAVVKAILCFVQDVSV